MSTHASWGGLTAHLHACLRPDQPTQVMIDIDGKPAQRTWLEEGGGLVAIREALEGVFALNFPGVEAASSVHACSHPEQKPSYRIALAPMAPLFASLRDAAAFMRGCIPMLRTVGRGTVDEAWWTRGSSLAHLMDRCVGMSKFGSDRVLSRFPDARWSHARFRAPAGYLERLVQGARPDARPLLHVAKLNQSPRKRSRDSLAEDDESARRVIERVIAREFGEVVQLGALVPNVPRTAFVSNSLFCPYRECKRLRTGALQASSKNPKRRHTKNPGKTCFGVCQQRRIVFCRCFSCGVGRFGQYSQRIADLMDEDVALL